MKEEELFRMIPTGRFWEPKKCYFCSGTGYEVCPVCFGNKKDCSMCKGSGLILCPACGGKGMV